MERIRNAGMNRRQRAFFILLRSGLWESEVTELSVFPLSEEEWCDVLHMSEQQTVQGLLYRGFQHLPLNFFPPKILISRWVAIASSLEKEYCRFLTNMETTGRILKTMGVTPILKKGLAVAQFYEHPAMRINGDIDWFVGSKDVLLTLRKKLIAKGYFTEKHSDGSISFDYDGTEIELHHQLIDLEQPSHRKITKRFLEFHPLTIGVTSNGTNDEITYVPAPILTLVMLNAHLMKHAFTVGVGLRHFCDMARAYHSLYGKYDINILSNTYDLTGLRKWSGLLHQFLIHFLGMPTHELPSLPSPKSRDTQRLLQQVLHDGNFGLHTQKWQKAPIKKRNRWRTVEKIVHRLPISLRYAPGEIFYKILSLSNISSQYL